MLAFLCGSGFAGFTFMLLIVGLMVLALPVAIATGFFRALITLIKELASVRRQ